MHFNFSNWKTEAQKRKKENKRLLAKAEKKRGMEKRLPALHDEAFSKIDCLQCANCCKSISPRFKTPDIIRVADFLEIKQSKLIDTYLRLDEDGDYVVKESPCPFLSAENYCSIYEVRPGDCRKYPYTDNGIFFAHSNTTLQNSTICPAVYYVLERLKETNR